MIQKTAKRLPRVLVLGSAVAGTFGFACLLKEYIGGPRYEGIETSNSEGKVVIITGANTGIGKETAWELARRKAKVYMACRDMKRCETASAPSRIINVSSVAHQRGKINSDDLNSDNNYDAAKAYAQSKLANVLFTRELANRLEGTGVTVNCMHPGIVDTEITRHMGFYNSWLSKVFFKPFTWPFVKSPKQGAQTVLYLAIDNRVEKISGKYFCDYEEREVSDTAKDDGTAKWLWAVSEKWTRLNCDVKV